MDFPGLGTTINALAIFAGSLVGLGFGRIIPVKMQLLLIKSMGLLGIGIGLKMFLATSHPVLILASVILGAVIGEGVQIEQGIDRAGEKIKTLLGSRSSLFAEGFASASILFCIGPMAILGSLADGIGGSREILFIKSAMDGATSIALSAALGVGVLFSSGAVLFYQGMITIAGIYFGNLFSEVMITEMTATGGLLILGIGINLISGVSRERKIAVANLLPAIALAPLITYLLSRFG